MKLLFEATFARDLKKIKDRQVLTHVKRIIDDLKSAASSTDIQHIKKLKGVDHYYRIRVLDYRIGLEIIETTIIFVRILHRKDIYKYFPPSN
jgi:mRNA interferase RelE/StbE